MTELRPTTSVEHVVSSAQHSGGTLSGRGAGLHRSRPADDTLTAHGIEIPDTETHRVARVQARCDART
jgi:hypothetical protein